MLQEHSDINRQSNKGRSQPKILIVEDDEFLVDMYSTKFSREGFTVQSAGSGQKALDLLEKDDFKPDICLVDIVMPDVNGFELVEKIRSKPDGKDLTIIMLSVLGQKEDITRSRQLGADGYITKTDITPSQLVSRVKNMTGLK